MHAGVLGIGPSAGSAVADELGPPLAGRAAMHGTGGVRGVRGVRGAQQLGLAYGLGPVVPAIEAPAAERHGERPDGIPGERAEHDEHEDE
jgi:hypothetical protein